MASVLDIVRGISQAAANAYDGSQYDNYSFDTRDNVYMTKYTCCYKCYIQWVEGREERWATGWRPNKGENK